MFSPCSANHGRILVAGYTVTNRQDDHKTHLREAVPRRSTGTLQRKPEDGTLCAPGHPVCVPRSTGCQDTNLS